ncbi:MAG: hypothetical protein ACR2PK_10010 [Acidimicrobiales bacterium]
MPVAQVSTTQPESRYDEYEPRPPAPKDERQLCLTRYLDMSPTDFADRFALAVPGAAARAAERTSTEPEEVYVIKINAHTAEIQGGVDAIDGAQVTWFGSERFTTITFETPWDTSGAAQGYRVLDANRFIETVTNAVQQVP